MIPMDKDSMGVVSVATDLNSLISSPGREVAPKIHNFSTKTLSAKWMFGLRAIRQDPESTFIHGIEFSKPGRVPKYELREIDVPYDQKSNLEDTIKQWDTTIKVARASRNLPNAIKAAQFEYFDTTSQKDLPRKVAARAIVPLEEYGKARHKELRREFNRIDKGKRPTPRKIYYEALRLGKSSASLQVVQSPNQDSKDSTARIPQPKPKPRFSAAKEYHFRLQYMISADQYHENPEITSTLEPVSNDLLGSPALILIWGGEKNVDNLSIFEGREVLTNSIERSFDMNNGSTISFRWCGDADKTLRRYQGKEIMRVSFKKFSFIRYNPVVQKLLFEHIAEDTGKQCEFLVKLSPIAEEAWMVLQTCCYRIVDSTITSCNMESEDYYDEKFAGFLKQQNRNQTEPSLLLEVEWEHPRSPMDRHRPRQTTLDSPPERQRVFVSRRKGPAAIAESINIKACRKIAQPIRRSNFGQHRIHEWIASEAARVASEAESLR